MQPVKPGYQTTEFWLTLLSVGGVLAVNAGVISAADMNQLAGSLVVIITSIATLIPAMLQVAHYTQGRINQKTAPVKPKGNLA